MIETSFISLIPINEVLEVREKQFKEMIRTNYHKVKEEFCANVEFMSKVVKENPSYYLKWQDQFPVFFYTKTNKRVCWLDLYKLLPEGIIYFNEYFYYFELERYLDGWIFSKYMEYKEYYNQYKSKKNLIILNPFNSLESHYEALENVKKHLTNLSRNELRFYRDVCPYCNWSMSFQLKDLKKTNKKHSFHCDRCGKRILLIYKSGQYLWSAPNNLFRSNLF